MYCNEKTAVKGMGSEFFAISLRCRSWKCDHCQDQRRRDLIAQAIDGKPTKFLTLTSRRRPGITSTQAARELARCWRIIRKRLMRHYKWKALPFLAVFEATKLGWPHLHILLRTYFIDQKLISKWMNELTGSPVVWVEALRNNSRAAFYVSKYIGKDTEKFGTCKRYWQSKDWRIVPKRHASNNALPKGDWHVENCSIVRWIEQYRQLGFEVTLDGAARAFARSIPASGAAHGEYG